MLRFIFILIGLVTISFLTNAQCETDTSSVHAFEFDDKIYEVVLENLTWENAAECATASGGMLAEINSQGEQDTIQSFVENLSLQKENTTAPDGGNAGYLWLGANDLAEEGLWVWNGNSNDESTAFWQGDYNGNPIDNLYNNWGGEPDNWTNQDALGFAISSWPFGVFGQWNDIKESNTLYYVVEYPVDTTEVNTSIEQLSDGKIRILNNTNDKSLSIEIEADYYDKNKAEITLFNLLGEVVYHTISNQQNCVISTVKFSPNIYILTVNINDKLFKRKVILD